MFALSILDPNSQFDLVLDKIERLLQATRRTDVVQLLKVTALIALKQAQATKKILHALADNPALSGTQW
jgi:uncharacterized protein HemY